LDIWRPCGEHMQKNMYMYMMIMDLEIDDYVRVR
jgi:hypothetical protein